eukprot:2076533-Pleurochrysis_carterae.AAC.1
MRGHFQRGLGLYPLRTRNTAAVLLTRQASVRRLLTTGGTRAAPFAAAPTADPRMRKQALI